MAVQSMHNFARAPACAYIVYIYIDIDPYTSAPWDSPVSFGPLDILMKDLDFPCLREVAKRWLRNHHADSRLQQATQQQGAIQDSTRQMWYVI